MKDNQSRLPKRRHPFRACLGDVLSVTVIVGFICVAAFAYLISLDKTTNANQMHLSIANKPPGLTVTILAVPATFRQEQEPALKRWFLGEKHHLDEIPIQTYRIENGEIQATSYPSGFPLKYSLERYEEKNPDEIIRKYVLKKTFWLGTDQYGRDLLSRLFLGARISLSIGFVAVLISVVVGVFMGALAGYFGGKTDTLIMWFVNIAWSVPTLLLVMAITLAMGKGFYQVFVAVGLTMWVEVARVVRGQMLSLKNLDYIKAAKTLGYSDARIILRHLLPNVVGPLSVISASNFATAILIESGLSFLGLGAQPPTPSWGSIVRDQYASVIVGRPLSALAPGACILLLVMALTGISNALRNRYSRAF